MARSRSRSRSASKTRKASFASKRKAHDSLKTSVFGKRVPLGSAVAGSAAGEGPKIEFLGFVSREIVLGVPKRSRSRSRSRSATRRRH